MRKRFKILSFLLVLSLLAGCLPLKEGKAATVSLTCETKKGISYVSTADEALDIMEKEEGGKITVNTSMAWTTNIVRTMYAHTKIIVPEDVTVTFEGAGMKGEGNFEVSGVLDLKNSRCETFHVVGEYETKGSGTIVRQNTNVGNLTKTSGIASVLTYGQKLSNDPIEDLLVGTRVYRDGAWRYRDLTTVYEAGFHTVTVYYDYTKMIYTPHNVEKTVQIQVEKANPTLSKYTVPQVKQGQAINTIRPEYSFTNPNNGEIVAGTLQFSDGTKVLDGLGEKQLNAVFVPADSTNYNSQTLSLKVNVVTSTPKIAVVPYASKGQYGQTLKDISLQQGSCVDSLTGEAIPGSWAWKNANDSLICGEHTYPAVFTPTDTQNYKSVETMVSVQTSQKKMTNISWPVVSAINEGQHLFEAVLSYNFNEYGTFSWEDDTRILSPEYQSAVLVFTPFDTDNYDWTNVAGYNAQTRTIKKSITLSVVPKVTEVPQMTAIPNPTEVPQPTEAVVPTQFPKETEVPDATDLPLPTAASTAPSESENPQMTPGVTASTAPTQTPVPTIVPTAVPTASTLPDETPGITVDSSPLPTEGTVSGEKPEQTPEPTDGTEPSVTEQPDGGNGTSGNSQGGSAGNNSSLPAATEKPDEIEEPVVVKKVITKISSIKTPKGAALKKNSRIKSIKRKGKTVKIVLKKVKKAKYEVRYAAKKNMKHAKKKRSSKRTIYIRKLKKNKKYYLQARIWKKKKGKRVYGKWSKKHKI